MDAPRRSKRLKSLLTSFFNSESEVGNAKKRKREDDDDSELPVKRPDACTRVYIDLTEDDGDENKHVDHAAPKPQEPSNRLYIDLTLDDDDELANSAKLVVIGGVLTRRVQVKELKLDGHEFLKSVSYLQQITKYAFNGLEHVRDALCVQREPIRIAGRVILQGNQRLAMLGDSVLSTVLLEDRMSGMETCGETNHAMSRLVSNAALEKAGVACGISKLTTDAEGKMLTAGGKIQVATTVEAILGAIWLDSKEDTIATKKAIKAILRLA